MSPVRGGPGSRRSYRWTSTTPTIPTHSRPSSWSTEYYARVNDRGWQPNSIGATPANTEHGRFPVSFYLVGMTFIIFDVEVVFLYPWATAFGRLGFFGLGAAVLFIGLITVPYILEWRRGGLDWD